MKKMSIPCDDCKFLKRKCTYNCLFARYFPGNKNEDYAAVHHVFEASLVATILNNIHPHQREDAMKSLAFQAKTRLIDPVYGCTGLIYYLQRQCKDLEEQLQNIKTQLASYIIPMLEPPPPVTYQQNHQNPMMIPVISNYGGRELRQLGQFHEETHLFESENSAQMHVRHKKKQRLF